MTSLDGKVALITGGGSGIGEAVCRRFAQEGARVCVVDFDAGNGRRVAGAIDGVFVAGDMGDPADVEAAFATCEAELGGVDIAFLNAGIAIGVSDIATLTDADYQRIQRVNVDGVVYGARAAVRAMRRRGGGAIVATSSLAGLIAFPPDPVYDGGKHFVVGFIRSIAPTLAADGITANTVNPGMTDTNILSPDIKAAFAAADFPLMPADQIAEAVLGIVTSGVSGESWVCQANRDPVPFEFRNVPGPRGSVAGTRPPNVRS